MLKTTPINNGSHVIHKNWINYNIGKIIYTYVSNGKMGRTRKKKYEHVKMCEHMRTFLFTKHLNEWVSVYVFVTAERVAFWFLGFDLSPFQFVNICTFGKVILSQLAKYQMKTKKIQSTIKRNIVDRSSKIEMLFAYAKFIERFVVHAINFIQFNILQSI